jgi:hypothetical protein
VCDAGWYALIYYGTANVWETTVSVSGSDCYIVFGDGELKNPETSGISDYAAAAFIDALHVILFPKKMMLPADWLITTEGAGGVLGTSEIYHEGETLAAFINDVEGRLDTVAKTTGEGGGLVDNVVTSDAIAGAEAVMADNSVNLLAGGSLEEYGDDDEVLFKVEKIGPEGYYSIDETDTDGSKRVQVVEANGSNTGIALSLNPNFAYEILEGKQAAATFRVKTGVTDSLEVGFWDGGQNFYTDTPSVTANEWTSLTVTKEIPSELNDLKAVIRTTTGPCTFRVARVQMNLGDKAFGFSISPYEDAARVLMHTTADNLLYNGGFELWTLSGANDTPDGWYAIGTPTFPTTAPNGAPGGGRKRVEITMAEDDGMGQYLGLVTGGVATGLINENIVVGLVKGRTVCASVELERDSTSGGSDLITLTLADNIAADEPQYTRVDVNPPVDEMQRFTVYRQIRENATQVWFEIQDRVNEGTGAKIYVDNAMLHIGEFPLMFKPSSGWREMRWDFGCVLVESTETKFDAEGINGGRYPMPQEAAAYLMLKAAVRCLDTPTSGGADTKFQVDVDGDADGISVSLPADAPDADNHITDYTEVKHECSEYIEAPTVTQINGVGEAGNVIMSVWGYYYAG